MRVGLSRCSSAHIQLHRLSLSRVPAILSLHMRVVVYQNYAFVLGVDAGTPSGRRRIVGFPLGFPGSALPELHAARRAIQSRVEPAALTHSRWLGVVRVRSSPRASRRAP